MMQALRFQHRFDRASGKAKEWAGRATGNTRRQRQGRLQWTIAEIKIKFADTSQKIMTVLGKGQPNRRRS